MNDGLPEWCAFIEEVKRDLKKEKQKERGAVIPLSKEFKQNGKEETT